MATQFIARGLNVVGAPAQRKRMNRLTVKKFIKGTRKDKSVWSKTLTRNGFGMKEGTRKGCKVSVWTPRKLASGAWDKRIPTGWRKRRYVVKHVSWTDKRLAREA